MNSVEIFNKAIKKYGSKNQLIKTIEELSELQRALCRNISGADIPDSDIENLFEEIADVEIMLAQCKIMFKCDSKVERWKNLKISRLEERIKDTQNMNCPYSEVLRLSAAVYTDCNDCPISECRCAEVKEEFEKEREQNV